MEINHRTLETNEKILILVFEIKDISMRYIHMKQKRTPKLKQWLQVYLTEVLDVLTQVFFSLEGKSYCPETESMKSYNSGDRAEFWKKFLNKLFGVFFNHVLWFLHNKLVSSKVLLRSTIISARLCRMRPISGGLQISITLYVHDYKFYQHQESCFHPLRNNLVC